MAQVQSQRAQNILSRPKFFSDQQDPSMRKFPGEGTDLWVKLDWEGQIVKNLSFSGKIKDEQKVLLESMASLLVGKPITKLDDLSLRECEAFLRDRNSEPAITGMTESEENVFRKVFQWLRAWPQERLARDYHFQSEKGPFQRLKLVDKVRELKAFLNSPEILTLYQGLPFPEVVDVDDLTVYIQAPYGSQREKALFEELHLLAVEVFQDENLNFIPEEP